MKIHVNELLLALRSPRTGWLAVLICVIDEAIRDPNFNEQQREIVRQLLAANEIPSPVSAAAHDRLSRFEEEITSAQTAVSNSLVNAVSA